MELHAPSERVPLRTDANGVIRVGGTRMTLDTVGAAFNAGATAEEIVQQYPPVAVAFALCVEDGGSEDLEARKLYQVLPDRAAAREGYIRVVDESGEDYIYPSGLFVPVRLPAAVVRRLKRSTRTRPGAAGRPSVKTRRARPGH